MLGAAGATGAPVGARFADAVPEGLVVADEAGVIRFVNRRLEELTGRSRTELVGSPVEELVPSEHAGSHVGLREHGGGMSWSEGVKAPGLETRLRTAGGTAIPVDVAVGFEETAHGRLSIISLHDARNRVRREALAEGSRRRLTELYEAVPLAILGLDLEGVVTYLNSHLAAVLGVPTEGGIGSDGLAWLIGADADPASAYGEILGRIGSTYRESRVKGPDGRWRQLGWHTVPVHAEAGDPIGTLSIGEDLTQRKRSEYALDIIRRIGMAVLSGEPNARIEQRICDEARELVDLPYAVLARPGATGCEVRAVSGFGGGQLVGVSVSAPWCSIGAAGPPVMLHDSFDDFEREAGIRFGPTLQAPLAEPPSCGFLLVADDEGAAPLDEELVELVRAFSGQANVVLEYGNRLRELAVVEDRERIARDLHDLVIQRIFSAGLTLQIAAQMVGDRPEVAARLADVTQSLDDAIGELRRSILGLEERKEVGLRQQVDAAVADMTSGSGLSVTVDVPDEPGPIPDLLQRNLIATLREALANTVRHASAQRVRVVVTVGDALVLEVEDDGRGLGGSLGRDGRGLSNLAARAASLGGALHLSDLPDGGVRVQWRVPLIVLRD